MSDREDRDRRRDARQRYDRRESAAASAAEGWHGEGGIYDDHAFLIRWGTAKELDGKVRDLVQILDGWAGGNPFVEPADLEAIRGLEVARDRLMDIWRSAEYVEQRVRERGWEFDPETRTLKEASSGIRRAPGTRGPRRSLVSRAIQDIFELLVRQGFPKRNTQAIRREIRSRLTETFHPDLLTDRRIQSIVNSLLNPDRH